MVGMMAVRAFVYVMCFSVHLRRDILLKISGLNGALGIKRSDIRYEMRNTQTTPSLPPTPSPYPPLLQYH